MLCQFENEANLSPQITEAIKWCFPYRTGLGSGFIIPLDFFSFVWFYFIFYQNIGCILSTIDQIQRMTWTQDEHIKWITEERASCVPSEQIYLEMKVE